MPCRSPTRAQLAALYDAGSKGAKPHSPTLPLAYANFTDYAEHQACFRGIAAFTPPMVMTLSTGARPERVFGEFVSSQYFDTLGLSPATGRFFAPDENTRPGSAPVAVLSYSTWKTRFSGATSVVGRRLQLNNVVFTVIGVAPPHFLGVSAVFGPDFWLPATMSESAFPAELRNALSDRSKPLFHVVGRLRPHSTLAQAQANLDTITAVLEREYPAADEGHGISARPVTEELYANAGGAGGMVFGSAVLLAVVALILAIACANIANLLLARAATRRREIAVRVAIGAGRGRLVRQLLTESALLSLLAFLAGVGIGYAGCRFVWSFVPAEVVANMAAPRLDTSVLLGALTASLATAFLFGLAPALRASKTDVVSGLKEDTGTTGRRRRTVTLANLLLAGQVSFSLLCLVTAALIFQAVERAYTIDPGFQSNRLALFMMNPSQAGYDEVRVKEFYRMALDRVANLPGVAAASWASGLPFWNTPSRSVLIDGAEQRRKSSGIPSVVVTVGPDYLGVVGIPLVEGRSFSDSDDDASLPVALINEALARENWPDGNALGHRFQLASEGRARQVIGIVKNANYTTLGEAAQPCVYVPLRQNFVAGMVLYVGSRQDPAAVLGSVQREIEALYANIQITDVRTGAKLIEQVLWGPRVCGSSRSLQLSGADSCRRRFVQRHGVLCDPAQERDRSADGLRGLARRHTAPRPGGWDGRRLLWDRRRVSRLFADRPHAVESPVRPERRRSGLHRRSQPGASLGRVGGVLRACAVGNSNRPAGSLARTVIQSFGRGRRLA